MPRVVIAAGGTAGHVVPALAVADALRASGAEVEFVGGERAEAELVPAAGYPLPPAARWRASTAATRCGPRGPSALAAARPPAGRAGCCGRIGADAVLGGGGYVAGPVGLAARSLRLPLVLTEADSHLGVTNRLLAPLARAGVPRLPDRGPRRGQVRGGRAAGARRHRRRRPRRGPRALRHRRRTSRACWCSAARWARGGSTTRPSRRSATPRPCAVLHACGRRDHAELVAAPGGRSARPPHYHLHAYVEPFADALAAADLVVARAGGSVLEVAAAGLPSILVPYPHATADHQTANARHMERAGRRRGGPRRASSTGRGWRARWARCCAAPQRMAAMAKAARGRWRDRTPPAVVADELLASLAGGRRRARGSRRLRPLSERRTAAEALRKPRPLAGRGRQRAVGALGAPQGRLQGGAGLEDSRWLRPGCRPWRRTTPASCRARSAWPGRVRAARRRRRPAARRESSCAIGTVGLGAPGVALRARRRTRPRLARWRPCRGAPARARAGCPAAIRPRRPRAPGPRRARRAWSWPSPRRAGGRHDAGRPELGRRPRRGRGRA